MAKRKTRGQRFLDSISTAQENMDEVRQAVEIVKEKFADVVLSVEAVKEVQEEYREWLDSMPEGLDQSPTAEKLEEITNLDFESISEDAIDFDSVLSEVDEILAEAEQVDFPLGFGRD